MPDAERAGCYARLVERVRRFEVSGMGPGIGRVAKEAEAVWVLYIWGQRVIEPQMIHILRPAERRIELGKPFGATVPDLFYEDPVGGVLLAVYLDGLSKAIHGNMERHQMDRMIRERLEEEGVDVIEIASSDLDDPEAMKRHLKRISIKLRKR